MRGSLRYALGAFVCGVALGLSLWTIAWSSGVLNEQEADEEARKNFGSTSCIVANITEAPENCLVVRVRHYLYDDVSTRLQWTFPDDHETTICGTRFTTPLGGRLECYADVAFIRVYANEGTKIDGAGATAAFVMSLMVACLAFAIGLILTMVAYDKRCEEREEAQRRRRRNHHPIVHVPPPPPLSLDEGYIDD